MKDEPQSKLDDAAMQAINMVDFGGDPESLPASVVEGVVTEFVEPGPARATKPDIPARPPAVLTAEAIAPNREHPASLAAAVRNCDDPAVVVVQSEALAAEAARLAAELGKRIVIRVKPSLQCGALWRKLGS